MALRPMAEAPDVPDTVPGVHREDVRRLFDEHGPRVRAIALHFFGGDASLADDIAQQVFVRLCERLGQFRGEAALETWLHRLVVNACLDHRRAHRRLVPLNVIDDAPDDARHAPDAEAGRAAMGAQVRQAIQELSPKLRIAVLLRHYEELSYEEMARALGCSMGTVASRLNRGHADLARRLRGRSPATES